MLISQVKYDFFFVSMDGIYADNNSVDQKWIAPSPKFSIFFFCIAMFCGMKHAF